MKDQSPLLGKDETVRVLKTWLPGLGSAGAPSSTAALTAAQSRDRRQVSNGKCPPSTTRTDRGHHRWSLEDLKKFILRQYPPAVVNALISSEFFRDYWDNKDNEELCQYEWVLSPKKSRDGR